MPIRLRLFTLLPLLCSSIVAGAEVSKNIEVTPLIGYRFGDGFDASGNNTDISSKIKLTEETSYGALLAWGYDKKRQGELLISHYTSQPFQKIAPIANNNRLSITYAHVGGNVPIFDSLTSLFITGGLGFTHFSPQNTQLSSETHFSLNLGLAGKIPVSEHISLRVGGRVYATLFNSDSQIFCHEDNCAIYISSDLWIQSEVNLGITVSF